MGAILRPEAVAALRAGREAYAAAAPFPHVVLDGLLEPEAAVAAAAAFPSPGVEGWTHYVHLNERKHGLTDADALPAALRTVVDELQSPAFVALLAELTGIEGLRADDGLEGGGLHVMERDGFLNVHADFTAHPLHRTWRRRANLLLYLNDDWDPAWGGDLELWSRDMARCERRVAPLANRVVIFTTDDTSFHGVPDRIACPPERARRSIALYYFTEEAEPPRLRSTNYRARPGVDRRLPVALDRTAVAAYTRLKRLLRLDDGAASGALRRLGRRSPRS